MFFPMPTCPRSAEKGLFKYIVRTQKLSLYCCDFSIHNAGSKTNIMGPTLTRLPTRVCYVLYTFLAPFSVGFGFKCFTRLYRKHFWLLGLSLINYIIVLYLCIIFKYYFNELVIMIMVLIIVSFKVQARK